MLSEVVTQEAYDKEDKTDEEDLTALNVKDPSFDEFCQVIMREWVRIDFEMDKLECDAIKKAFSIVRQIGITIKV